LISDHRQIQVIGSWELEKRNNVDTSPITAAMLTDLIGVVSKAEALRDALGFKSKRQFDKVTNAIPNLRNQIMHPVRPLILCQDDVTKLHSTLAAVLDLTDRVTMLNASVAAANMRSSRLLP